MTAPSIFGHRFLTSASAKEALVLEREAGRTKQFEERDALVTKLLYRSLAGERIATLARNRARGYTLVMPALSGEERDWLHTHFSLQHLQSRGQWKIKDRASLEVGILSLPWALSRYGRYGVQIAAEERGPVSLDTPEALFIWSVLAPVFKTLYQPAEWRTLRAGEGTREKQLKTWNECDSFLRDLDLGPGLAFQAIRYGSGWSRIPALERHEAVVAFLEELSRVLHSEIGSLFRLHYARPLIEKYYAKAKKDGSALKKRVVTNAIQPVLAGCWSGSWVAFVDYLGERLHPDEHIVTAKPDVELALPSLRHVEAVATEEGLSASAVAAVAAAVFGENSVEKRIACMRHFWDAFDELHARQKPGKRPLWGLVDSGILGPSANDGPYQEQLFREVLEADLNATIDDLWGGHMWSRFPDRILTEWTPHARMAEVFGPALRFWEGVALTAWFVCEGPYSRTDLRGLREYHAREVAALEDMGMPIDPALFRELDEAEDNLGPEVTIWENEAGSDDSIEAGGLSITITTSMSHGTRREGFEIVRDLTTRHRRAWAEQHLDAYLNMLWESELKKAGEDFLVLLNQRQGNAPTLKQFAKKAADATNHWLGGDVSALYRLLKEKCPATVEDARRVIGPPHRAARRLYDRFVALIQENDLNESNAEHTAYRLLRPGVTYVRWLEGAGTPPERDRLKDFSYYADRLASDAGKAWRLFESAIEETCLTPHDPPQPANTILRPASPTHDSSSASRSASFPSHTERHSPPVQLTGTPGLPNPNTERIKSSWWRRLFGR